MGPQTGFPGSALSVQTILVGGHLAQNGPQDWETPLFSVFAPFRAPNGAAKFLCPPDPLNPVNHELRPQEAEPSEVAGIRRLRKSLTLLMSQKIPENSPVAPSYGRNVFLSVGSLTDRAGPQLTKWPPAPPKPAISRAPGTHGTANRVHWVRI